MLEEIVEETIEDLELQADLVLTDAQILTLKETKCLILNANYLKPYISNIITYLMDTPTDERVWACFKNVTGTSYVLLIQPLI